MSKFYEYLEGKKIEEEEEDISSLTAAELSADFLNELLGNKEVHLKIKELTEYIKTKGKTIINTSIYKKYKKSIKATVSDILETNRDEGEISPEEIILLDILDKI